MRVSWERMDVLGPVYRMVAQGLNNAEIAKKLGFPNLQFKTAYRGSVTF